MSKKGNASKIFFFKPADNFQNIYINIYYAHEIFLSQLITLYI